MRVLIAHASQASRTMLADAVRRGRQERLDVVTVGDGAGALELLLQDEPPEVALVDWDLPGIEGPEMCRLVRDFHHGHDTYLAVLASSGHADTADAWRAGADDCISTPAPAAALRDCVAKGLRDMRAPQALDDSGHVTLEAVRRPDDEVSDEVLVSLSADLLAAADLEGLEEPTGSADLVELAAERLEPASERADEPRGPALLDALLTSG